MVTPFALTPLWIESYLHNGHDALIANSVTGTKGKDFARTLIGGRAGDITLSIPVEGGASVLKRANADPALSNHGKWRREHLGAWNAAYARTPFFVHLMPELEQVYANPSLHTLEEFNRELLNVALRWVIIDTNSNNCRDLIVPAAIREERRKRIRNDHSVFETIFMLGKEAALALSLCCLWFMVYSL
ncbi:MAG: WbqC family protein [Candidatus Amulumruptor caecigallinarius]|nr:WbqC family protein [Candidatus Amulumruptor caecigallinarius]